jgi:hypothetical protein
VLAVVALLLAVVAPAGYRWWQHDEVGPGEVGRCYQTPRTRPQGPFPDEAASLRLSPDPSRAGVMTGDPVEAADRIRPAQYAALVRLDVTVSEGMWQASGWLTRDRAGRTVVVTSAAAVMDNHRRIAVVRLADIKVTDTSGSTAAVTDGCVIYESPTEGFERPGAPPPGKAPIDHDVAVLVLDREIGSGTLQLSEQPARRGTWYATVNLGGTSTIEHPRRYNVLGLGHNRAGLAGWNVLSGLQPFQRASGAADFTDHGASGSAVTTIPTDGRPPQVVGIIIGGFKGRPADPARLRSMFGFELVGRSDATPKIDYITPAAIIAEAIAALPAHR